MPKKRNRIIALTIYAIEGRTVVDIFKKRRGTSKTFRAYHPSSALIGVIENWLKVTPLNVEVHLSTGTVWVQVTNF